MKQEGLHTHTHTNTHTLASISVKEGWKGKRRRRGQTKGIFCPQSHPRVVNEHLTLTRGNFKH